MADATGTTVWKWDQQEPFGNNVADDNPSGLGVFDLPLRLPGQYFDKETNLHYNYFRDYDSAIGRYVQSDPIGLRGGLNTFAYVTAKPLLLADPLGLQQTFSEALGLSPMQPRHPPTLPFEVPRKPLWEDAEAECRHKCGMDMLYGTVQTEGALYIAHHLSSTVARYSPALSFLSMGIGFRSMSSCVDECSKRFHSCKPAK